MRFRFNPFLGFVRTMTVRKFRRKETSRPKKEKGKAMGGRGRGCRVRSFRPTFQTEWLFIIVGFVTN